MHPTLSIKDCVWRITLYIRVQHGRQGLFLPPTQCLFQFSGNRMLPCAAPLPPGGIFHAFSPICRKGRDPVGKVHGIEDKPFHAVIDLSIHC
jgi:hypothetical protein